MFLGTRWIDTKATCLTLAFPGRPDIKIEYCNLFVVSNASRLLISFAPATQRSTAVRMLLEIVLTHILPWRCFDRRARDTSKISANDVHRGWRLACLLHRDVCVCATEWKDAHKRDNRCRASLNHKATRETHRVFSSNFSSMSDCTTHRVSY